MKKYQKRQYAVEKTNDSSVVSKASMASSGYFEDPFIKCFIQKLSMRSSLINRGYYVRVKAVDYIFKMFFDTVHNMKCQVVSLGAGFDSSFFRMKHNGMLPSSATYFEIDFKDVIKRKIGIINNDDTLLNLIDVSNNDDLGLYSSVYRLIPCDLCNLEELKNKLIKYGVDFDVPTLILSECVMTYMNEQDSSNLIKWCATCFSSACFVTYEQIIPDDGFGRVMKKHFQKIGSPLKSIDIYKTSEAQSKRYSSFGWTMASVMDMNSFYFYLDNDEQKRVKNLEIFDEYEEFHLKCSHYTMLLAVKGNLLNHLSLIAIHDSLKPDSFNISLNAPVKLKVVEVPSTSLLRYGHTSNLLGSDIITVGGFGNSNGCHKRIDNICITNIHKNISFEIENHGSYKLSRMFHQSVLTSDDSLIVVGGRFSPTKCCTEIYSLKFTNSASICSTDYKVDVIGHFNEDVLSRWRHTANIISSSTSEMIYVYGGIGADNKICIEMVAFNLKTSEWKKIECDKQPSPRHSHASSIWQNDKIIISGGLDADDRPNNTVYLFNTENHDWEHVKVHGLMPRYSHTSNIFNDKLLLLGGISTLSETSLGLAVINLIDKTCLELKLDLGPEKPIMLHKHSVVLIDGSLIIIGGGGNCFSFGSHFNSDVLMLECEDVP